MATELPSVWAREPKPQRDQRALSREHIVTEAIGLLDEEGVEALSMRKLGARLNAGATSLYTHVANKDELIELVVDEVFGEVKVANVTPERGWREAATTLAYDVRATILRHPWVASALGGVGLIYLGPNMSNLSEDILGLFEAGGFTLEQADHAMSILVSYVLGTTSADAALRSLIARSGQDERELTRRLRPLMARAAQGHTRLRTLMEARPDEDRSQGNAIGFAEGVRWILDGFEAQLETA
ncbi:MAG: TetR/AcrR family transcriptional regulator [Nonomuraea sp.]|nr:TetR/AcrR family transcriptional regulator [Nonomuraea sp.]